MPYAKLLSLLLLVGCAPKAARALEAARALRYEVRVPSAAEGPEVSVERAWFGPRIRQKAQSKAAARVNVLVPPERVETLVRETIRAHPLRDLPWVDSGGADATWVIDVVAYGTGPSIKINPDPTIASAWADPTLHVAILGKLEEEDHRLYTSWHVCHDDANQKATDADVRGRMEGLITRCVEESTARLAKKSRRW